MSAKRERKEEGKEKQEVGGRQGGGGGRKKNLPLKVKVWREKNYEPKTLS